jgi:hypothetical protein
MDMAKRKIHETIITLNSVIKSNIGIGWWVKDIKRKSMVIALVWSSSSLITKMCYGNFEKGN